MSSKGINQLQQRIAANKPPGSGSREPTYVVGVGASAGGLESLERMFRHVSLDTGMAFVVVQHLSPDFKSMMSELLARSTSMRIQIAEDGLQVESNTLYLMPPKNEMLIADGRLHLLEKDTTRGVALPIDRFFESLAREYGERAIAIVLSGSGTDGTRGIAEISRCGGLVLSESLATAKFDGMPSSAQATGLVDVTVAPEEIGQLLLGYANDSDHILRTKASHGDQATSLVGIEAIYQLFRSAYDIDFASYKDSTVLRRIHRRLTMKQCESVDQYVAILKAEPAELQSLYGDLLIGVTQFFRDPRVFEQLIKEVLPRLVSQCTRSQGVRAWVAGCATGEEAYSVAIAFREALRNLGADLPVKLFATDIHRRSIEYASRGYYCTEALQHLSTDLRERYFTLRNDGYQVRPEIRQMIVFSPHNVLRDAPFTGLDFVSCRNLLIYLRPAAQHRAITLFHYSLRVGGVMLLGGSETTGDLCKEFEAINERLRLYRKTRDVRLADHLRVPIETAKSLSVRPPLPATLKPASASIYRTQEIHQQLHARFMPPAVLIDSTRCVLDTFAGAERLLRLPAGQPTFDILNLVDRQIRTSLSGAIGRATKEQMVVQLSRLNMASHEGTHVVDLTVEPLVLRNDETLYLIIFNIVATAAAIASPERIVDATTSDQQKESQKQIQQLEDDLRYSRENLQATIEELETSNEELQATNEELIASNEELQSTNEELHSLNEELYSVNAEYQRKIEELAELNRDMNLLLENTDVAMVFLDDKLQVRRFTSRVSEIFELIDDDIGRSIGAFAAKLPIEDLVDRLQTVLITDTAFEQEVRSLHGQVYLMRLLPYHTGKGIGGIVMMWVDISSIESLRGRLRWLSAIVESTSDAIIGQQLDGTITSWNHGAEELYGYKADEIIGQPIDVLTPEDRKAEIADYRQRIQRGETIHAIDTIRLNNKKQPIHVSLTVSPVVNSLGEAIGISKIARDISTRIRMEQEIREQVTQREYFLAMLSHELRNPFNAIHCASQVVADPRLPEDTRQMAIQSINRQVSVVNHLLTDLLDVARIAENRINLQFEILDLRELSVAVKEMVQPEIDRHKCQLVFEFEEKPALVRGDRTRLIQVQVNLIHNAAKYSETDSPIVVKLACEGPDIHLSISDQGRGIPVEQLDSIFKPFAQLDQSLARSDGGLGVGLTLAKSLVELHGGSICAESVGLGHGSTFHVRLPRADSYAIEPSAQQQVAKAADPPKLSSVTSAARPQTILNVCIVEDMADSRELMKAILEIDGHRVLTASTGRDAIELLTSQPIDLAIIDVGLPDISGYEVAQKVRNQVSRSCRLVALTGFCQPADVAEALQAGFDEHMVKPLDIERLEGIIAIASQLKAKQKSSASS